MNSNLLKITIVIFITLFFCDAYSCSFDTDCEPGSKCNKPWGSLYGVCSGGMLPGNSHDKKPVTSPTDLNGTFGNTCSFDTDCGPGSRCVKSGLFGTCMK